ncbi:uncharacterized protein LOC123407165 isoform X4 [Hordeum vulgare subsp. vulgare]|uniref:uncharacterized protein LOC123407165 isoform X4 n=1 Tax=Hordeum vulgare subsp. vulgare TaxID=112509 RepID=UPI001D1A41B4|nr:uncharacterized protein LOC123407165 isoform X4 [Hordeum vulgare subsp. vulgare]
MDLCSCVWGKENSEFGNKSMEFSGSSGSFIYTPETQSEIATVIQGILLGLFLLPLLYKSSLRVWVYCRTLGKQQTEAIEKQAEKRADSVPQMEHGLSSDVLVSTARMLVYKGHDLLCEVDVQSS